uniref:Putative receptor-like serine/threonine-protein kinase At5g57670 n=1 Tax=Anthurium amnicola TaxID=1678845 RepID=A0A1D1Y0E5_9ARAE
MGALELELELEDGQRRGEKPPVLNGASQGGGETVVVGVRMDGRSRELLTWALVKAAEPGDTVVALHVLLPTSSDRTGGAGNPPSCSSVISLIKSFDSVLAAYEGFCNLKKIDLKLKICRGSSLRKLLVREANSFAAARLVLGVAKNSRAIGSSSTSIAKYCARKLPRECSVLAVDNGKIVFQRVAPPSAVGFQPTELETTKEWRHMADLPHKVLHNSSNNSKITTERDSNSAPSLSPCDINMSNACRCGDGWNLSSVSSKSNCAVCEPVCESAQGSKRSQGFQSKKGESKTMVRARLSSLSLFVKDSSEPRPGWSFLRRAILHDKKMASDRTKNSVVQCATPLPARYSASAAVHPERKPSKSAANAVPNLDSDNGAIVPLASDASHPSNTVSHEEQGKFPKALQSLQLKYSSACRLFGYHELVNATSNFSAGRLVGKGGCSRVYKGCLPDGKEIAVKILQQSEDVLKEFVLEVEIITTLCHKNIISLFGFCFENENFVLVCDFLSRGSLEDNLHGNKNGKSSLGWIERYKVAMGVAEALDYLHGAGTPQPVIHRDVKSSNILLADDCEPRLSDFGLAKWASSTSSHMTSNDVAGTFGYLAPEYFMYGKVNEKVDVYAFGVVLLELLTGRKPIDTECPKGRESLVMWAMPFLQSGNVAKLLDLSLGDKYDNDQVERMILAASLCIRRLPRSRPRMALVLKLLKGDEDILKWAKHQTNALGEFDGLDDEPANPVTNIQSHLSLALLDVEDDSFSVSSTEHTADYILSHGSLDDYLQGRWSRSSSFD